MTKSAAVIIATIGKKSLKKTIECVLNQTYGETTCVVVVDGEKYKERANEVIEQFEGNKKVQTYQLIQNTGANGYVCHRIYGAMPLILNQDYIFYCDDDNWYDPEHVELNISACETNKLDWSFSLRKIFLEDGNFLCNDECESLGYWPVWYNEEIRHIDTNCFCFKRETAIQLSASWHRSRLDGEKVLPSADTIICNYLLKNYPNNALITKFSVNYNLGSWVLSPKKEFFLNGNKYLLEKKIRFPWKCN